MESCRFWGTGPSSMGRDGPVDTFLSPENLGPGLGREPLVIEAYFHLPEPGHPCLTADGRAVSNQLVLGD